MHWHHYTIPSGRSEIMETLLDAGMDPNCSEVETGELTN